MSIATGQPRGIVVFVKFDWVAVVRRERISTVAHAERGIGIQVDTIDGQTIRIDVGGIPDDGGFTWSDEARRRDEIFSSIVDEDQDVVWHMVDTETQPNGSWYKIWARTPDQSERA